MSRTAREIREIIYARQGGNCALCWHGMRETEMHAHHRQRRRDFAGPTWCACNVVGLHAACHVLHESSVHQQPSRSVEQGLIVPTWEPEPSEIVVHVMYPWRLPSLLQCDGTIRSAT